jgi:hypothetical protein
LINGSTNGHVTFGFNVVLVFYGICLSFGAGQNSFFTFKLLMGVLMGVVYSPNTHPEMVQGVRLDFIDNERQFVLKVLDDKAIVVIE